VSTTVGLVGCGRWGRHILRDLIGLGCEVTVVAQSEETRVAATEGGASAVVGAVAELPEVRGIVVATPTKTHADIVDQALDRGIPLFVEKPLTDDAAAAERLASAAPDRLFVMDKWRYHPGVEALAEIARSGELGRVVGLRTTRIGWGNRYDVDAVWILAPHELSIGLEILGSIPDARSAVADSGDGLVGLLGDDPWHALTVSARSVDRRREIALLCADGVAILGDAYSDHLQVATGPEPELRPISTELPLLRELRAFVEFLEGGPPPRSSAAEGAAIVRRVSELRALAGLS
jgi:predicted dehydrogenase